MRYPRKYKFSHHIENILQKLKTRKLIYHKYERSARFLYNYSYKLFLACTTAFRILTATQVQYRLVKQVDRVIHTRTTLHSKSNHDPLERVTAVAPNHLHVTQIPVNIMLAVLRRISCVGRIVSMFLFL